MPRGRGNGGEHERDPVPDALLSLSVPLPHVVVGQGDGAGFSRGGDEKNVVLSPGATGGVFLSPCAVDMGPVLGTRLFFAQLGGDASEAGIRVAMRDGASGVWVPRPGAVLSPRGEWKALLSPEVVPVYGAEEGRSGTAGSEGNLGGPVLRGWRMFLQANGEGGFDHGSSVLSAWSDDGESWQLEPGCVVGAVRGCAAYGTPRFSFLAPRRDGRAPSATGGTLFFHRYADPLGSAPASILAVEWDDLGGMMPPPVIDGACRDNSGGDDVDDDDCDDDDASTNPDPTRSGQGDKEEEGRGGEDHGTIEKGGKGSMAAIDPSTSRPAPRARVVLTAEGPLETYAIYAPDVVTFVDRGGGSMTHRMFYGAWSEGYTSGDAGVDRKGRVRCAVLDIKGRSWIKEDGVVVEPGSKWDTDKASEPSLIVLDHNNHSMFFEGCGEDGVWRILNTQFKQ